MDNYKLYIFDWDGTLMDSIGRIVSSLQLAAKQVGLAIPTDVQAKSIIGLSLSVACQQLFPGITQDEEKQLIAAYRQQFLFDNPIPAPLFEHGKLLLERLQEQGKLIAVATGKARAGLDKMLLDTETHHLFDMTICADESQSKPNPHMLNVLLAELSIATHEAVMVGDSIHDLTMANNAGVDSVGITLGADSKTRLQTCNPNAIVDSILELGRLLTGNPIHSSQTP
ncbi:HAD-IA family hydrolase [Thalassotalea sp. M1531]|uniref:HAD-IA family hydrolase n=1 Tax=Thalassotalea algicola TaxID=2716224 RepID=A0A7Y0LBC4_9GAMM|nr:HAD-IA family hydrolase [Thalassotalea algicola]NMP31408.1 HAD-IA family hydrolase [Thalassotalea algicola]